MGTRSSKGKRIQGRAGVALRRRRVAMHPVCRVCYAAGTIRATDVIDHILPLASGGLDVDANCQGLCHRHHDEKTELERPSFAASNHPDWLKPSAIPLTIVCGPPCSGKTTYINEQARPGDVVICLDSILAELQPTYRHWMKTPASGLLNRAIRRRNNRLAYLSKEDTGRAWFIVSAPSQAERDWWANKLGGQVILLNPGPDECKARALTRGTPKAVQGIEAWGKASRTPWLPPAARKAMQTTGLDGWPVGSA